MAPASFSSTRPRSTGCRRYATASASPSSSAQPTATPSTTGLSAAREAGFLGFGFHPRSDFTHIDLGPKREWGERFAPRPAFAVEIPPARERLAESRTIKGGGVTGAAAVVAAGVEVAETVLAETREAVLPLVPYLDTLRWVFIAAFANAC